MASNEQTIWKFFKNAGFTDAGAAGMMGNLYAESGLIPNNLQNTYNTKLGLTDEQYTQRVDNGSYTNFVKDSAGYGIAQWTFWSRKQNLLNFAKAWQTSIGDLNMQLNFLLSELTGGYRDVLNILKSTNSVLEASNAVLLNFERPQDQSEAVQNKRAGFSQNYYNKYATTQVTTGGTMKYSESNPPIVCMQTNSTCYKQTRTMKPLGILWHSTGAGNPTLKRYIQPLESDNNYNQMIQLIGKNPNKNDYNHSSQQSGLNAWIGKLADGTVAAVQSMPWNYRPWGCGSGSQGSCNNGYIQFEMCEDVSLADENYFNAVYKEACELTAYLCKLYNLNPNGYSICDGIKTPVILCHADSYKLGLGSNHSDVMPWFNKYGKTMDDVRRDVAALLNAAPAPTPVQPTIPIEEDEDMTQEKFNEMMNVWIAEQANKEPSEWSLKDREWAESNGLIAGDNNGRKMYKKYITREEFFTVLHRFYDLLKSKFSQAL